MGAVGLAVGGAVDDFIDADAEVIFGGLPAIECLYEPAAAGSEEVGETVVGALRSIVSIVPLVEVSSVTSVFFFARMIVKVVCTVSVTIYIFYITIYATIYNILF